MRFPRQFFQVTCIYHALINFQSATAALSQEQEAEYLANFNSINAASYVEVEDTNAGNVPPNLLSACSGSNPATDAPSKQITVQAPGGVNGIVSSSQVSAQCGTDSTCILPAGTTLRVDTNLNLGALLVRGGVEWTDSTQLDASAFICAGYVAVEGQGKWEMDLQTKTAYIYLKDNGATHHTLRTRAFGGHAENFGEDNPTIDIKGREMKRTWSLLSQPLSQGDVEMRLMHDPNLMEWSIGDRVGIAPTEERAKGHGEEFVITDIRNGAIYLDSPAQHYHEAEFFAPAPGSSGSNPALKSAEVVNLSRSVTISGDDFRHVPCENDLLEAVPGEETSTEGCRCSSFRKTCTVGLHTAMMNGGVARIQNTRIERCGQRGIEGKYCLHFHKLRDCPDCLFKNNAIETSHQRGIIIHSTHSSTTEGNVLYNVRGAGVYIEDGNEMYNSINYNSIICPFPFNDDTLHGCTIPGTSNRIADTSDNQSGIFSRAMTNPLRGNRVANAFNGMFFQALGMGRGGSSGHVCEADAKFAQIEGNTFHSNGRFGTYTLGSNYPKVTDQSISSNGYNTDIGLCSGFDDEGYTRGLPMSFIDQVDYGNAFVGHYNAGDMQHQGHQSFENGELLYWKETKNFENQCSAHITGGSYFRGNLALPDQATIIIENTSFGESVTIEPNHHCNVGTTGVLCFPQYLLHGVQFRNRNRSNKWFKFQSLNFQGHAANQNHGGVFSLSPPDAQRVMDGGSLEHSIFPDGYVSLVSWKFTYLLSLPDELCVLSSSLGSDYGLIYDGGILCKVPLRSLKIYSRGQVSGTAQNLKVEIWFSGGINNQIGTPDSSQFIGFHQIGSDFSTLKQGYSLPVIPGVDHSYRLSLAGGMTGNVPLDWVVEFSDLVVGNRFGTEFINLAVQGRSCGDNGVVSSHHDRKFIWSGEEFLKTEARGACADGDYQEMPMVDCTVINNGVLAPDEDCGSGTCKCKAGFYGVNCSFDLCEAARCGEHGTCSSKYLGGDLPTMRQSCICDEGWSGPLCQYNPCEETGLTCSGQGTCVAVSDTEATCQCDGGFSGPSCENSCDGFCSGDGGVYPYGCSTNSAGAVKYGCHKNGGCNYPSEGQNYPSESYCTYKEERQETYCFCGAENECELTISCRQDGSCPTASFVPDNTPCNSVVSGVCRNGVCSSPTGSSWSPTRSPIFYPTSLPMLSPTHSPILPTKNPTTSPTKVPSTPTNSPTKRPIASPTIKPINLPTKAPTMSPMNRRVTYCGCPECDQEIWDLPANDGGGAYTCGQRILWLQSAAGESMSEYDACNRVAGQEFSNGPCGPKCNPLLCKGSPSTPPTEAPTKEPTTNPTKLPTKNPTTSPTKVPSTPPTDSQLTFCGCPKCTESIWNAPATDNAGSYTCGARITWLQSPDGGSMSDYNACLRVAGQDFLDGPCGPECSPDTCNTSSTTTTVATTTTTISSTTTTRPQETFCGCPECTESIWNAPATDGAGTYTCGARIQWLQSPVGGSLSEYNACLSVAGQGFPSGPCGPKCNPLTCNPRMLDEPNPAKLIWNDEFDTPGSPDPTKWKYDLGDGCDINLCNWGNGEQAYYTNTLNNVEISDGILQIKAKRESGYSLPYTSARMVTRGTSSFKYGRVQFRAKISQCTATGTWPALWMLPDNNAYGGWPKSGEIDVMEFVGYETGQFHGTVHTEAYNHMIGTEKSGSVYEAEADWHVFEINWEPTGIQFAIDGRIYSEFPQGVGSDKWPFDQDFHIIMNVAVGGFWGGSQGIDEAAFSGDGQIMEVDWVRVYSL